MGSLVRDLSSGGVLGQSYDYASHVPTPGSLGVSTDGSMDATGSNISAGMSYVGSLITGPNLGRKYFLHAGGQCVDGSNVVQDSYKYIDTTVGNVTGFSAFSGELQGLLPGVVSSLEGLNPLPVLRALVRPALPSCVSVTCPIGDVAGVMGSESR